MLDIANVGNKDTLIDLGCGDGRIVIAAAKRGAKSIGVDIDPQRLRECRKNSFKAGVKDRVKFVRQDLFETDISQATVVTMYLLPQVNIKLRSRLLRDLTPGTVIVSHAFDMGDWKADNWAKHIYSWTVPVNLSGKWRIESSDEDRMVLTLSQRFQKVKGSLMIAKKAHSIRFAKLKGNSLEFKVRADGSKEKKEFTYKCRMSGDSMQGRIESESGGKKIKARRDPSTKRAIDKGPI